MKTPIKRFLLGALALGAICFATPEAQARLPKPIQIQATVVYVDHETQTAVIKPSQPTKEPKPFVLDWNKDTQFIRNGQAVAATDLKPGTTVTIHYKHVSFRNPLVKKISWEDNQAQGRKP